MADEIAEVRHAIEQATMQQLDAQAGQRQWSAGFIAQQRQSSPTGAPLEAGTAVVFATGYDSGTKKTIVPFCFGLSTMDGPDTML